MPVLPTKVTSICSGSFFKKDQPDANQQGTLKKEQIRPTTKAMHEKNPFHCHISAIKILPFSKFEANISAWGKFLQLLYKYSGISITPSSPTTTYNTAYSNDSLITNQNRVITAALEQAGLTEEAVTHVYEGVNSCNQEALEPQRQLIKRFTTGGNLRSVLRISEQCTTALGCVAIAHSKCNSNEPFVAVIVVGDECAVSMNTVIKTNGQLNEPPMHNFKNAGAFNRAGINLSAGAQSLCMRKQDQDGKNYIEFPGVSADEEARNQTIDIDDTNTAAYLLANRRILQEKKGQETASPYIVPPDHGAGTQPEISKEDKIAKLENLAKKIPKVEPCFVSRDQPENGIHHPGSTYASGDATGCVIIMNDAAIKKYPDVAIEATIDAVEQQVGLSVQETQLSAMLALSREETTNNSTTYFPHTPFAGMFEFYSRKLGERGITPERINPDGGPMGHPIAATGLYNLAEAIKSVSADQETLIYKSKATANTAMREYRERKSECGPNFKNSALMKIEVEKAEEAIASTASISCQVTALRITPAQRDNSN